MITKHAYKLALASIALAIGMTASTQSADPTFVDLTIGPVAVNSQAVNVALAVSVEFPTVGAAYRNATYDHATEYIGYWDPKACYDYLDTSPGAPVAGEYFYRTGAVDIDGYCNSGGASVGTGYSGNVLNYVATSSIDLLRLAVTGGDRFADTPSATVLGRAFLRSGWLHASGNFPTKRIPVSLEGKVTPDYPNFPPTATTTVIFAGSCDNRVVFGTASSVKNCTSPGTSGDLNKLRSGVTGTNTVVVETGETGPSLGTFLYTTTTWASTTPPVTVTTITSADLAAGHPVVPVDAYPYNGLTTTAAPVTVPATSPSVHFLYTQWTANTATTAAAPTTGEPVVPVSVTQTLAIRYYQKTDPGGARRVISLTSNSILACRSSTANSADFRGAINASGAIVNIATGACGTTTYAGLPTALRFRDTSAITTPINVFEPYATVTRYRAHTGVPIYRAISKQSTYIAHTSGLGDFYSVPILSSATTPGAMFARVRVCDADEATTRADFQNVKLCQRYPDGNYKPIGELQRRNEGMRVASFGYLMDDTRLRHGGVLRAPMRFTGPTYRSSDGQMLNNPNPEWQTNNGIFLADPIGPTVFGTSGVINSLNKFGRTGVYKTFDPVGELYYEALRYFQGLPPTPSATAAITPAMYDGFPVYNTAADGTGTLAGWVDPIQNSCQRRNFILGIGDVNTHNDRHLPGHGGSSPVTAAVTAEDPARATEPLLGDSSKVFNAAYWTQVVGKMESNTSFTYTDSQGRTQNAQGNPNPRSGLNNLETRGAGATNAAYYFAGAAYWANTQPIRLDSIDGKSLKDVRVKTFMIDVDEGGDGSIQRDRTFYLAGKYGWFNDENGDGNPFKGAGGIISNREWEDPETPNVPDGYAVASQSKRLIEGIRKFFSAVTSEKGAVSVSSLSSQRYTTNSPDGDLFAPRFDTRDWSGTVQRSGLRLNSTTGAIESQAGAIWDAGLLLTAASLKTSTLPADALVLPEDRRIFTANVVADGKLDAFQFKSNNFSKFDPEVLASLNKNPFSSEVDGLAAERVNYLRGGRGQEKKSSGGIFRARNSIMGDIINSGPIFKQNADPTVQGAGYDTFSNSVANRTATVFVGTNGGMLHAFRARDGKEQFAYVPHAISKGLSNLTHPSYAKRAYVDAVPAVREAYAAGSWRTVLASGFGGGANGIFALDVTNPDEFKDDNVLFEFTDRHDAMVGNVLTQPKILKFRVPGTNSFKWYVVFGSGYNTYVNDGLPAPNRKQSLFFLSLDKGKNDAWAEGTNYFKISVAAGVSTAADALANPGSYEGAFGEVLYLYAGDLQGRLWRFDLSSGLNASRAELALQGGTSPVPLFNAKDGAGLAQPITITPLVQPALDYGLMVVFGTGKFVEPKDAQSVNPQAIYGVWDPLGSSSSIFNLSSQDAKIYGRTLSVSGAVYTISGASSFSYALSGTNKYRGWRVNFDLARERVAVEGAQALGAIALNSTIPEGECSGDGQGKSYCLDPSFGTSLCTIRLVTDAGLLSRPNIVDVNTDPEIYQPRTSTGGRKLKLTQQLLSTGTKLADGGNAIVAGSGAAGGGRAGVTEFTLTLNVGRVAWREIRNFND